MAFAITDNIVKTTRHTTYYQACGAEDATPIIFVHGWPELSASWRHQLPCFAALGFRAIAPDMRGYGQSSVYARHEDYALEHSVRGHAGIARKPGRGARRYGLAMIGAARWSGASPAIIRASAPES